MSCLICAGEAQRIEAGDTLEERHCPVCGHYRMCTRLIASLMEQGQIFDVSRMRAWLMEHQGNGGVPCIQAAQARLVS